jgi:hypothetical protein
MTRLRGFELSVPEHTIPQGEPFPVPGFSPERRNVLRVAGRADQARVRLIVWIAAALTVSIAAVAAWAEEPAHTVAVLRFRVHSAKPIDYLGESLANLIRSRLEARSEIDVTDP